jgi:glycosyltransferase involved in cell wall biosynthesis
MSAYYSLADAAVFSFTEILTSGSVIVALSYGLPAIVPDKGDMPWIIEPGHNGYLYHSTEELKEIITQYAHSDQDTKNHMSSEAQASMEKNSYLTIAQLTLQAYGIK